MKDFHQLQVQLPGQQKLSRSFNRAMQSNHAELVVKMPISFGEDDLIDCKNYLQLPLTIQMASATFQMPVWIVLQMNW